MKAIHAIWKNGQIIPAEPIDWPDGTNLSIALIEAPFAGSTKEDLWSDDPSTAARRVAFYESLPPLKMSTLEEAEWQAARREMKDYTLAKMRERGVAGLNGPATPRAL